MTRSLAPKHLKVSGTDIVETDPATGKESPILLRGAGLGGWMNMENFITGYPGHECELFESGAEIVV